MVEKVIARKRSVRFQYAVAPRARASAARVRKAAPPEP
jgi:hypothetical protein